MATNLTSPVDHTPENLYTAVKLDHRKKYQTGHRERGDPSTRIEDPTSESSFPLMMTSSAPSHTYTNEATADDVNSESFDVDLAQGTPPSLPAKHARPVLLQKQRSNSNRENGRETDISNLRNQNGNEHGKPKREVSMGYVVPSSVFGQDGAIAMGDYVDEDSYEYETETGVGQTNGYLTPTEFTTSSFPFESKFPSSSTSSADDERYHRPPTARSVRKNRFDSGVGDCGNSFGSSPPSTATSSGSASSNPRISTHAEEHYEDIDQYRRDYTKGRGNNKSLEEKKPKQASVNGVHHPWRVNIAGVTRSVSEDVPVPEPEPSLSTCTSTTQIITPPPPLRHERVLEGGTLPHMYSRLNIPGGQAYLTQKKGQDRNWCGRFMLCLFFLMCLLSMASFGISVYVLLSRDSQKNENVVTVTSPPPTPSSTPSPTVTITEPMSTNVSYVSSQRFQELKSEFEKLKMENQMLKNTVDVLMSNTSNSIESLQIKLQRVSSDQVDASSVFDSATQRLRSEIANISLTPGPRGRQGVGNFSLCEMKSTETNLGSSATKLTNTDYAPDDNLLESSIVLFAFCRYEGATKVVLDYKSDSWKTQYRCKCSGQITGVSRTTCRMNYLMCPRLTLQVP